LFYNNYAYNLHHLQVSVSTQIQISISYFTYSVPQDTDLIYAEELILCVCRSYYCRLLIQRVGEM
jgi:hypothetical protein